MTANEFILFLKNRDAYSIKSQAAILRRMGFYFYLRKGIVPHEIGILQRAIREGIKFNPYYDELGRFTTGPGATTSPAEEETPQVQKPETQLVQEIPPLEDGLPSLEEPLTNGPRPSPNFEPPTNPPQLPPAQIPEGWRVREMQPTQQYPNGYWRLEKPMDNGGWQSINPSTMKPGPEPETHIPFPFGTLA